MNIFSHSFLFVAKQSFTLEFGLINYCLENQINVVEI